MLCAWISAKTLTSSPTASPGKAAAQAWTAALFPGLRIVWMSKPREWWGMVPHPAGVQDQFWGQSGSMSLLMIWVRGLRAHSVSSQTTLS